MTDLRKAAEMALEALESFCGRGYSALALSKRCDAAIKALRQALAEPANSTTAFVEPKASSQTEQEPVAWVIEDGEVDYYVDVVAKIKPGTPLYTAPPKREWVGYTNEDRKRIVPMLVQSLSNHDERTMAGLLNAILIDIEQQLKEKNHG
jgi:hypothetical protein